MGSSWSVCVAVDPVQSTTRGVLSIGESGTYPYWLVMWGCSDCTLGLTNGSTTVAITAPSPVMVGAGLQVQGAGGSAYLSSGTCTGVSGVIMDEYPPSNAENDYQPCTAGSPSSLGNGEWFCPTGGGSGRSLRDRLAAGHRRRNHHGRLARAEPVGAAGE